LDKFDIDLSSKEDPGSESDTQFHSINFQKDSLHMADDDEVNHDSEMSSVPPSSVDQNQLFDKIEQASKLLNNMRYISHKIKRIVSDGQPKHQSEMKYDRLKLPALHQAQPL